MLPTPKEFKKQLGVTLPQYILFMKAFGLKNTIFDNDNNIFNKMPNAQIMFNHCQSP